MEEEKDLEEKENLKQRETKESLPVLSPMFIFAEIEEEETIS